jgi:hypothetical protein
MNINSASTFEWILNVNMKWCTAKGKRMFAVNNNHDNVYWVLKYVSRAERQCETMHEVPLSLTVRRGVQATFPT